MDIKQRDGGGRQEREERSVVLCKWKSCLTLAVGSIGTRNDEREGEAVTLQKQGRRRSGAALHARLVLLTAHQESSINDHFTPKSSLFSHYQPPAHIDLVVVAKRSDGRIKESQMLLPVGLLWVGVFVVVDWMREEVQEKKHISRFLPSYNDTCYYIIGRSYDYYLILWEKQTNLTLE